VKLTTSAEVKWIYASTPPYGLVMHRDSFTLVAGGLNLELKVCGGGGQVLFLHTNGPS
jgi:hypothetical protein